MDHDAAFEKLPLGLSRSAAVRAALVAAAAAGTIVTLADEVAGLEADEADRTEMLAVVPRATGRSLSDVCLKADAVDR